MRNRNAVRHAARNFAIVIAIMILVACGQNPGGDYTSGSPILPAVADTVGSSLDLTIPLDVAVAASNPQRFAVRGKYIAIDPGSTGQANLRLNSISDTARLAYPGSTFNPGDFIDLYFDYLAQPGKFLHVIYGDSPDILSSGNKTSIDPALNVLTYEQTSQTSAIQTIVPAAANVRGIKILGGTVYVAVTANNIAGVTGYMVSGVAGNTALASAFAQIPATITNWDFGIDHIQPYIIPPGVALVWQHSMFTTNVNAILQATIALNYEIL